MYCIPVIAQHTEEAIKKMSEAASQADIFEIRLDLMSSFDIQDLIKQAPRAVLVTYRSKDECGEGEADVDTVTGFLTDAAQAGADYVQFDNSAQMPCYCDKCQADFPKHLINF